MRQIIRNWLIPILLSATSIPAFAGGSAEASAQALNHSVAAIGYSVESVLRLASGVAAVPLMSAGGVGHVMGDIGNELWDTANAPPIGPFPVTHEVVTASPRPPVELEE